jgi:photosystem II stability/assembly factor-like uncharacterized protein
MGYDARRKVLYVATHTGMFELREGSAKATRIGDSRQDTMGFTLVTPSLFLGSGHPDARENLPPHLGLIRSTDGGRTWTPVSLLGKADFHVLRAQGTTIYGFDISNERLLVSSDSGQSWTSREAPEALIDLAVDPNDPKHVLASGGAVLYRSRNGGRSWNVVASGVAGYLAWPATNNALVATFDGVVLGAQGATGRWRARGSLGREVAALLAVDERMLFAALHDGTIKQSTDGGVTWKVRTTP